MSVTPTAVLPLTNPHRKRFTRTEYHFLYENGLLGERNRYELIDGDIIELMPQKEPHGSLVMRLLFELTPIFGESFVRCQMPVVLADDTEPKPDLSVTAQPGAIYVASGENPPATDLRLVVEVSVATREFDLITKALRYAQSGVPEYWMLDVEGRSLIVYRDPRPRGYLTTILLDAAQTITPLAAPQTTLRVADFLP